MPPKAKKRKIAPKTPVHNPPSEPTVVFKSPGLEPDTRLRVFDTEFHVHSTILRLHSNYFRKFLDSPDKPERPAGATWRYDYATVIDDDGTWALEFSETGIQPDLLVEVGTLTQLCALPPGGILGVLARLYADLSQPQLASPGSRLYADWLQVSFYDTKAFQSLLSAMYNRPYTIWDFEVFEAAIRLADFYCALPVLSATLTPALMSSLMFYGDKGIAERPRKLSWLRA